MPKSKREIIQSNIYRILPKVIQVSYTLDTICEPNIIILSQAVLKIFCLGLQSKSRKKSKRRHNKSDRKENKKPAAVYNVKLLATSCIDATVSIGPSLCSVTDGHHFLSN